MKLDAYSEIYLWNKNVDALIRVLQRMEALCIIPRPAMKAHEFRLEEIRAALNGDFAEKMATSERMDEDRLRTLRVAWEEKQSDHRQLLNR